MNPISLIPKLAWQAMCAFLVVIIVLVSIALWFSNSTKDKALDDLKAEQGITAVLKSRIEDQNTAIKVFEKEGETRMKLVETSMQLAEERTESSTKALEKMKTADPKSCTEAMEFVNEALKGLKP